MCVMYFARKLSALNDRFRYNARQGSSTCAAYAAASSSETVHTISASHHVFAAVKAPMARPKRAHSRAQPPGLICVPCGSRPSPLATRAATTSPGLVTPCIVSHTHQLRSNIETRSRCAGGSMHRILCSRTPAEVTAPLLGARVLTANSLGHHPASSRATMQLRFGQPCHQCMRRHPATSAVAG